MNGCKKCGGRRAQIWEVWGTCPTRTLHLLRPCFLLFQIRSTYIVKGLTVSADVWTHWLWGRNYWTCVDCFHVTSFWFHLQKYFILNKSDVRCITTNPNLSSHEKYLISLIIILAKHYLHKVIWQTKISSFYNFKMRHEIIFEHYWEHKKQKQ